MSQSDSDKVNRLISFIQKERDSHEEPVAGDMIEYTTRSGDYYAHAHIERIKDGYQEICLSPYVPFCYEDTERASYDTGGEPWTHLDKVSLEPAGIRAKLFKTWGHCGRCASGAVYFKTFVRVWRYTEPEPLFEKYTTKEWTKYFISKMPGPEKPGEFTYAGDGFMIYSETEFNRLVQMLHGEVICHDSLNPKNFVDGWKVNTVLTRTGIPTIKKMSMEEYQTSRDLPLSPYTTQKTAFNNDNGNRRNVHRSFPQQATLNL